MADSSGTYYLEAASFGDLYTGTYKVSATQTATPPTDDFSADTSTSGSVSVGGSTTGELETAVDKDWFKITLETNVTYKFDLEGSPTGQGTHNDPYIKIYDMTGREVASNDNSGTGSNAQLTYKAVDGGTSSGIYYIEASSGNSGTGTYKLSAKKYGYNLIDGHGRASAESAFEQLLGEEIPDVNNLGGNLWGLDRIGAPEVWSRSTGDNITVAVIDTGVDLDHSEFAGRIVQGWDFVDDDNLAEDEGYFGGHGTHVAGTIAGANDGVGITGVAYNADIMPIRVLDGNNGGYGTLEDIAAGVYYAVDNGADIINLSLGSSSPMPGAEAVIQYAEENGVVVVMAAGNDGNSRPGYPARYADDFGIAVGATNYYDNFVYNWSGSSSGSDRAGEPELQYVTAPGESIYSAYAGGSYATLSGTSMAAPHVSGIAALLLGYDNSLSASRIEELIITSASNRTDSVGNSSIDNFTGQPLDGFTSNSTALWEV